MVSDRGFMQKLFLFSILLSTTVVASANDVKAWAERVTFDQKASMSAKVPERQCVEYIDELVKVANKTATNRFYPADNMPFFNGHRDPNSDGWAMMGEGPYTVSTMAPPFSVTLVDQGSAKALMEEKMVPSESEQIVFPAGKVMVFCSAPTEPFSGGNTVTFCECTDVQRGCSSLARESGGNGDICGTPLRLGAIQ